MNLTALVKQTNNNKLNLFVGICLILAFVIRVAFTSLLYYQEPNLYNVYEYSEFLINYQGGFVRRGLLGDLLYQLFSWTPFPIILLITVFCYLVFFFVIIYFFYQFYKHKYCWWILLSPLFLGFTSYIVRKDYMLYSLLIVVLYVLKATNPTITKRFIGCAVVILGLFLHEAFLFWGFPIYAIILLSKSHYKTLNWILVGIPVAVFGLLSIFKGSTEVAHGIVDSWNSIIPGKPLSYALKNSIGALSWDTRDTFLFHWNSNINIENGGYGIILLPLFLLAAYYLFTNFLYVFNKESIEEKEKGKLAISLLYSLIIICMIPMFTVLSCDTGRNFQYISVATFATFLIIPQDRIISAFPYWYRSIIIRFNDMLLKLLPTNKGLLIILLLFIGMSADHFSLETCWNHSVIGTISKTFLSLFI